MGTIVIIKFKGHQIIHFLIFLLPLSLVPAFSIKNVLVSKLVFLVFSLSFMLPLVMFSGEIAGRRCEGGAPQRKKKKNMYNVVVVMLLLGSLWVQLRGS